MTTPYDVAVVGGGLAGAASCISARQHGLRVAWVAPEAAQTPLGDSLSESANAIVRSLGVAHLLESAEHRPQNTLFSAWGSARLGERHAITSPFGAGYVLNRTVFQAAMRRSAETGTTVWNAPCVACKPENGGWNLTLASGGGVQASALVDATGRAARLGRRFTTLHRLDRLVALATHVVPSSRLITPTPATLIEADENGWWYAALIATGMISLFYFSDPDLLPAQPARSPATLQALVANTRSVARWLDELDVRYTEPVRLASAGTTWLEAAAGCEHGAYWLAVGDAAMAFDPLSSHGMTSALWGGWHAGRLIRDALAGHTESLAHYQRALERGRRQFLMDRTRIYGLEQRYPASRFWARRHARNGEIKQNAR